MSSDVPVPRDVRMHGFTQRVEVETVLKWIDQHALRLGHGLVSLDQASGRVMAKGVIAPLNVPAFDRSAMDGYAVHGAETAGASDYNPLAFSVLGQALPGQPFDGQVLSGTAVRVMTGAAVPTGADAVVPALRGGIRADSAGPPVDRRQRSVWPSMSLIRAGSLDPREGR